MALTLAQRAAQRVKHDQIGNSHRLYIPLSPRMEYASENQNRGVGPDSAESRAAQEAICDRLLTELGIFRLSLPDWIKAVTAGGSLPQLAARLVGMPLNRETRQSKVYKAEIRKLQEYAQGKYKDARGARRGRIAAIGGPGNPYSAAVDLFAPFRGSEVRIGCRADWQISEQRQPYSLKAPNPERYFSVAHNVIMDKAGLIPYVGENTVPGLTAGPFSEGMFVYGDVYSFRIEFSR